MRFLLSIIFFFLNAVAFAQQQMGPYMAYGPETKYFSTLNYRVYQSKNGYLWFGTTSGLIRFDGKRYINYFSNYANANSPADNTIFDIAEDKNGDLWFAGFYHGVTKYDQHTGRFKKYPVLSKDDNPYYGINRILDDVQGNLWFATSGRGLAKYNFEKDSFELFFPQPTECRDGSIRGFNHITDIEEDKNDPGILWIGTFHGLYAFDKLKKSFTCYGSPPGKDLLITSIEHDNKGLLWLGSWGQRLNCFDLDKKKFIENKPV
ncbi:MAG: two-component regulator propeller domain-containing protein, partial [Ferruginibacter sp.]